MQARHVNTGKQEVAHTSKSHTKRDLSDISQCYKYKDIKERYKDIKDIKENEGNSTHRLYQDCLVLRYGE